jgi:hypothetical protein
LAAETVDAAAASRWRQIAADYDKLAEALEAAPASPPAPVHIPMQQQPLQQQQSRTKRDGENE